MSDLISRQAAIDSLRFCELGMETETIANLPSIDAIPVVRCKDCKWWTKQEASLQGRCDAYGMYPTGEWYCARGEKR